MEPPLRADPGPAPLPTSTRANEPVPATLRQLLSHSSGLPVAWSGIIEWGGRVPSMDEYLGQGQRTIHPSGERVVYANDGFALAGYVAAQAAGQPLAELGRRALLEPLGMRCSTSGSP